MVLLEYSFVSYFMTRRITQCIHKSRQNFARSVSSEPFPVQVRYSVYAVIGSLQTAPRSGGSFPESLVKSATKVHSHTSYVLLETHFSSLG